MKRLFIILILITGSVAYSTERYIQPFPMKIGEKLTFAVKVLGMYIGDQTVTVDAVKQYQGRTVIEGWGTSVSKRKIYYLNDKEKTYFDPYTLDPLYNERWVHQGEWIDRMWFWYNPEKGEVDFKHHKGNNKMNNIKFKGKVNSFYTMIAYLRSLDYDYYIQNNKTFSFGYLFGIHYKISRFKASYMKVRYQNKLTPAVKIQEIGGMGYEFIVLLNQDRIPYRMIIPSDKLRMIIYIKAFKRGTVNLPRK